jgi:molybdenum cofactor cytidylyltransferase
VPPKQPELHALLRRLSLRLLVNPRPEAGMGSSLARAIKACPDADGWVVALADMPWIRPDTVRRVAAPLGAGAPLVAPSHNGRRGHPVGFSAAFYADLPALDGDLRGRHILEAHPNELLMIAVHDPGIPLDMDTPADPVRCARHRRRTPVAPHG